VFFEVWNLFELRSSHQCLVAREDHGRISVPPGGEFLGPVDHVWMIGYYPSLRIKSKKIGKPRVNCHPFCYVCRPDSIAMTTIMIESTGSA